MTNTAPLYTHDCDTCTFLGQDSTKKYDLYFHNGMMPTLIARFGHEGRDYCSGMVFAETFIPLGEAKQLAINKKLLPGYNL